MNAQALWAILLTLRVRGNEPTTTTLKIKNLHVCVAEEDGEQILQGVDLEVKSGEIHTLIGPSGSGKSTASKITAGHLAYEVTDGEILLHLEDDSFGDLEIPDNVHTWNLLKLEPNEHVAFGIFLGFQCPAGVESITMVNFLRVALNTKIDEREGLLSGEGTEEEEEEAGYDTSPMEDSVGDGEVSVAEFQKLLKEKMDLLGMDKKFIQHYLNAGFSNGERKRSEILQAVILEPSTAVLDEVDSGLNIDRLQDVSKGINALCDEQSTGILRVIHYQRILGYVEPGRVHVMLDGKVTKGGDTSLTSELKDKGYDWIREKVYEAV